MNIEDLEILPDGRMTALSAAQYIGVGFQTLALYRTKGTGPVYVKMGRIYYFKHDLDKWIESHKRGGE